VPIEYPQRAKRQRQDWLALPVAGISPEDADAYAKWLAKTGRVPRARLCSELEWERAARGADARRFPHGDRLADDDADIDVTYGRLAGGFGPDEVGSHPASTSPFGLLDAAGNVEELCRPVAGHDYATRGGSFYQSERAASVMNANHVPSDYRHLQIGVRVCADAP
jgi:eukaryotic-like serine/threonine-protein kinase